jgi:hypothetical protein
MKKKKMSVARLILPLLMAPALVVAAASAAPALAVVVFKSPGNSHRIAVDGLTDPAGKQIAGTSALDALLTLRLTATDGFTWRFDYEVENNAGSAFDRARITGFGFDVVGTAPTSVSASGEFDRVGSGAVATGFDTDLCFMAAGNGCATNSNSGIRPDDDADGTIRLSFATRQQMVELSDIYVRWQGSQIDRAVPRNTPTISVSHLDIEPAPEPAVWAMMILGFGLVGAAARRRRSPNSRLS